MPKKRPIQVRMQEMQDKLDQLQMEKMIEELRVKKEARKTSSGRRRRR